jgi:hypothetical protein
MKAFKTKGGFNIYLPSSTEIEDAMMDGTIGFCIACGETAEGVEPDAHGYTCESCDKPRVYGAEELAMSGRFYTEKADA